MTKKVLVVLPAIILIGIGVYFIFATSPLIRYWVDDFCSATLLRNNGFFASQLIWWKSWTGRFSYIAALDFFELIGPWAVRVLPVLLLGFLIVSLKSFYRFGKILPVLFIFLTLFNAPNIIQSFYWQTGSLNYIAPFIFLNVFLGILAFPPKNIKIFLPAVLLFIAGGFSEAYALAQIVLLTFALAAVRLTTFAKKEQRLKIVLSGIVGAILTLGIMSLSPGNAARANTVTHPESIKFVIVSTLYGTKWYLLRMLSIKPFVYSLFSLFTSILVLVKPIKIKMRDSLVLGGLSILTVIFTTAAVVGSGFYSMAIIPPERTLFIAIYMIFLSFTVFSFVLAPLIQKNSKLIWVVAAVNLITSFFLIKSVISNWSGVYKEVKTYAVTWDGAEKDLPLLKDIPPVGGLDSFTDNKGWVASCVAGYYKLPGVKIRPHDDKITK